MKTNKSSSPGGQPGRTSDSRPRPGSGIPTAKATSSGKPAAAKAPERGQPKPSSSPSALDPGRPVKT